MFRPGQRPRPSQEDHVPTYAYACTACDHRFEIQQSFTDAAVTECPECGGRVRKLFNSVGIVFKGSGFYRTDSRDSTSTGAETSGSNGSAKETSAATAGNGSGGTGKDGAGKDGAAKSGATKDGAGTAGTAGSGSGSAGSGSSGGRTKSGTATTSAA
jgi:putative FmdB family regulatory protein